MKRNMWILLSFSVLVFIFLFSVIKKANINSNNNKIKESFTVQALEISENDEQKMLQEMKKNEAEAKKDEILIGELYLVFEKFGYLVDKLDYIPQEKYLKALEIVKNFTKGYRQKITSPVYTKSLNDTIDSIEHGITYVHAKNAAIGGDYDLCKKILHGIPSHGRIGNFLFLEKYIQLGSGGLQSYCTILEATMEKNIMKCNEIENNYTQDGCRKVYITKHGEINDCATIIYDLAQKISCVNYFSDISLIHPSVCVDLLVENGDAVMRCLNNLAENTLKRDLGLSECLRSDIDCIMNLGKALHNKKRYINGLTEEICISAKNDDVAEKCIRLIKE